MTGRRSADDRPGDSGWDTVVAERDVLVVARTPVALNRLLDVLPALSGDPRVRLVFTVDPGSRFSGGLPERLAGVGARLLGWDEALRHRFDLAIAASDNGDLHRLRAPLVLLPHGVGYQRYAPREPGAISGLRRSTLVHGDRVVPSTLVLAHPGQLDTVRAVEPRLVPRAAVAGDPCLDRITLSARRRDRYRAAFGAGDRRLVVLCSTWGTRSLFGRYPELPARVTGELDVDRYRTALVLHPHVWARHGALQVRAWLRPALDAGLVLVPPEEGWRAALVAADTVLSDHGSLTCYATAAGVPVLMAADGGPEVVPGSPVDRLRRRLPALRHDEPIREQVDAAAPADPELAGDIVAHRGRAAELLRAIVYRELALTPPEHAVRVHPVPVPDLPVTEPPVLAVHARLDGTSLTIERRPALTHDDDHPRPRHLAADESVVDPGWLERAAVVWRTDPPPDARAWARATLRRLPGARVAVTPTAGGDLLATTRDGRELTATGTTDPALAGSAVYVCVLAGVDAPRSLTVDTGVTIHLR